MAGAKDFWMITGRNPSASIIFKALEYCPTSMFAANRTQVDADGLLISPISFWEVAMLVTKGRIELDQPTATWANDVLAQEATEEAPLTPAIAVAAGELPEFPGDPVDRVLVATAQSLGVPLLTKDDRICSWATEHRRINCIW